MLGRAEFRLLSTYEVVLILCQEGVLFSIMAPNTKVETLDVYTNRLMKVYGDLNEVNSLDKLIDVRIKYLIWLEEVRVFLNKNDLYKSHSINLEDRVKKSFFEGGVGFAWEDDRSQLVLNEIREEVIDKIHILEKITPISQWDKIIQKKGDTFYYLSKPISVGRKTIYYHLLDVLLTLSDQDGFLSYQKIIFEINVRRKDGLIEDSKKEINKKTISNARDYLFQYSKLNGNQFKNLTPSGKKIIETVRGKGLKINNETI